MTTTNTTPHPVAAALGAADASVRLRAALAAGSHPDPVLLDPLVRRCAVEPDFFVRDMLSWALTRLPPELVLPRLRRELDAEGARARGQALHTLSKIGDRRAWAWITRGMLRDADDDVARTAWRVAVALVPEEGRSALADELVTQLGRGGHDVRLSLSRALVDLGDVVEPVLARAAASRDAEVAAHARATELLRRDPETGFDAAIAEAQRIVALGPSAAGGSGDDAGAAEGSPAEGSPAEASPAEANPAEGGAAEGSAATEFGQAAEGGRPAEAGRAAESAGTAHNTGSAQNTGSGEDESAAGSGRPEVGRAAEGGVAEAGRAAGSGPVGEDGRAAEGGRGA
ncbi:hypothetical protein ACFXGA_11570 [Actinosynnema sp. NPDC059335]|uniref:hypothetical protein n=1 Tax=Actinosynnema sp. NPDC059335 TaxID=3346804 RepID=UPI00366BEECA